MRIAFMVAAHTDAKQLENLVNRLAPNEFFDSRIFLHIDAKSDIELFKSSIQKDYVQLTEKRIDVVRCGITQVDAGLELIKAAIASAPKFDRYVMITGQDYPIVSNKKIKEVLSQDCELMRGYKVTGTSMNAKVRKYYFYNKGLTGSKIKELFRRFIQLVCKPFSKDDTVDFNGKKWDIYYSSAYFAVSYGLLCELYEKGNEKDYYNYFKTAICMDEMYFITIAANGQYRDKLEVVDNQSHTLVDNSAITYFNYQNRPIVFTQEHYDELKKSGRIFSRKFSSKESHELIKLLETEK